METLSTNRAHGGTQGVYRHASTASQTPMTFSVFVPEGPGPFPVLWYLSGLTCTHANVTDKGEYRAACAKAGVIFIAPDTSPRGEGVADDDAYDFGQGAGFYVDAMQAPFAEHYQMRTYIEDELPALIAQNFPADMMRQGITGHSMGGHGALTIGLRNPDRFKSISAFAPICHPMACPWGEKAFGGYLGNDRSAWRDYDAVALIEDMTEETRNRVSSLLVDQGAADNFLAEQLNPEALAGACQSAGIDLTLRLQEGYDHSYYFISTFMADHIRWHAARLKPA
ncbi:MAG: S-formylglutathione hydrolase [Litorimonas sp.]